MSKVEPITTTDVQELKPMDLHENSLSKKNKKRASVKTVLVGLGALGELEGVVVGPGVAEVGVEGAGAVEPLAGLCVLALGDEELGDGDDDVRVVVAALEGLEGLALAGGAGRGLDLVGPELAALGALLEGLGAEVLGELAVAVAALEADGGEPEVGVLGVLEARELEDGPGLGGADGLLLEGRRGAPEGRRLGALLDAARVEVARGGDVSEASIGRRFGFVGVGGVLVVFVREGGVFVL